MNTLRNERFPRVVWTVLLVSAAAAHFLIPDFFVAYYPSYLPLAHEAVALSAVVEIILAVMLWSGRTRHRAWIAIALLMLIYTPVHVYVITHHDAIPHPPLAIPLWLAWLRLPVQFFLTWWAAHQARTKR